MEKTSACLNFKKFMFTILNTYIDNQEAQESLDNDKVSYHNTTSNVPIHDLQTYNSCRYIETIGRLG